MRVLSQGLKDRFTIELPRFLDLIFSVRSVFSVVNKIVANSERRLSCVTAILTMPIVSM